jgi:hypothetical protein
MTKYVNPNFIDMAVGHVVRIAHLDDLTRENYCGGEAILKLIR